MSRLPPLWRNKVRRVPPCVLLSQNNCFMKTLRIGTRGSELALAQTRLVMAALQARYPELRCEYTVISTAGDQRTDIPLHRVNAVTGTGDKGVFIATIEEALARGEIDCAVHSLKDMPGVLDPRFCLAAVLPRESVQDVLVEKVGADMRAPVIATGSVRRMQLVQSYWKGKARTVPVRGNVATRLRKLAENPEVSATLLARAGLNRLGYGNSIVVNGVELVARDLPVDAFPPALGQGAIAVETRADDASATALISAVNHAQTYRCISCERAFLSLLNADCSVPVGGNAREESDGSLRMHVVYYTPQGRCVSLERTFAPDAAESAVAAAMYEALCAELKSDA